MLIQKISTNIYANYSSSIIVPKLIKLRKNLTVALFELMKLIPAKHVIMQALAQSKINLNYPIVETSSGTYALGMGIVCSELKLPFIIISDPVIDKMLEARLHALGGKVQLISCLADQLDVQTIRLEYLHEYLTDNKKAFWPSQYDNPENRVAYYPFAQQLLDAIGKEFTLVGAVGSGGSMCGTIEKLREANENIKLIGVDTFGSILFGLDKNARKLRGLGNSIMPKNLIHHYFDQVHWVSAEIAYKRTRDLHASTGLFRGPTTGAAYQVARWVAENHPDEEVVFISADSGYRYASTVYDDHWIRKNKINLLIDYLNPTYIKDLKEAKEHWSYVDWNRRNLL